MNASTSSVSSPPLPRLHRGPEDRFSGPGFLLTHLWLPLLATVLLTVALKVGHGDQAWADGLFGWEGHRWALKHDFFVERVLHRFGREVSIAAWLALLAVWLWRAIPTGLRGGGLRARTPLATLLLSTLLATALVAWVKSWSNMDCPWDLVRYGGERAYVGLFGLRPVGMPRGVCFPAGHASAGYAWVALYFYCLASRPRWRWLGLAVGLGAGAAFGFAQQLRGAHFASHDLWTAAICWFTGLAVHLSLLDRAPESAARPAQSTVTARAAAR